ncbi:MAG: LacI family DNA-binding transcriptional regulator [Alphaproteobacteria bacterium]|nr:LacI family DNA-binding transcriptional regulator [Alphaproteobacteria bacterium]
MQRKRFHKNRLAAVTLQDVADHAGVSTATVSRYLTSAKLVREERRQRIQQAIEALGYIPHGAAQALASQRSRTIGAIVPTLDNAIFATGIHAFQQRLQAAGYTLFIASSDYSLDEERTQAETLIARGVDGMMLIGSEHHDRLYERLHRTKMPYVNTWSYSEDARHPCIGFDNYDAAFRQASYLLDIGHRRFGIISGITQDNDRARDRLRGILDALGARGIAESECMVFESPYDIASSRQFMRRILAADPVPTAVACGNDVLAYGALLECQSCGHQVPDDISIVGFDDLPMSQHIQPNLTTMHVPSEEMGRRAADFLLARLNHEIVTDRTKLEANLIVRKSTAPPPMA